MATEKLKVTSEFKYEVQETGKLKARMLIEHYECDYFDDLLPMEAKMQNYINELFSMGQERSKKKNKSKG